ncbi:hypothetical protein ACTQZS_01720 [Bilifractor sp. LCP19S3_H10]|jgi:hypothetical protein|uniref:hypothetical protein n=1 Tax=Bilifractor sp. LCP19S3_H10 TaxID=3438736 RepID=UPI003F052F0C
MAMNPMMLMKLRERMQLFQSQHPKFQLFLSAVGQQAIETGTIIEVKVTRPDGKEMVTNLRLTEDDVESIRMVSEMQK